MPKLKNEEVGSLPKCERQKLQRLYTEGSAAYIVCLSVRNLVKASNLLVSNVGQLLQNLPIQNLILLHVVSRK